MSLKEGIKESNKLLKELIIVTNRTRRTLTMVNLVNIVTLIFIGYFVVTK